MRGGARRNARFQQLQPSPSSVRVGAAGSTPSTHSTSPPPCLSFTTAPHHSLPLPPRPHPRPRITLQQSARSQRPLPCTLRTAAVASAPPRPRAPTRARIPLVIRERARRTSLASQPTCASAKTQPPPRARILLPSPCPAPLARESATQGSAAYRYPKAIVRHPDPVQARRDGMLVASSATIYTCNGFWYNQPSSTERIRYVLLLACCMRRSCQRRVFARVSAHCDIALTSTSSLDYCSQPAFTA